MVFAIKVLLVNIYELPNLFEFKSNHFNSLFQAEYEIEIELPLVYFYPFLQILHQAWN